MEEIFVNPECPFSVQTFDLLELLFEYGCLPDGSYGQDFKENVEKPFQELCRQIAAQLPYQIVELINSPLLDEPVWDTNDWQIPHYSTENNNKSEQLFLQLDQQSLRFGFTIADESLIITVVLNSEEVLRSSAKQLSTQIAQTFKHLFPLVLLATCDNPLSAIRDYLKPNYGINFPLLSPLSNKTKFKPKYDLSQCAENIGFAQDTLEIWVKSDRA
jgi:hypothetical protein